MTTAPFDAPEREARGPEPTPPAPSLPPPVPPPPLPAPDRPLTEGRSLGKYHLDAQLGRGAAGIVFRARHPILDRLVAIKVLAPRFASGNPDLAERFLREARLMARVRHPNLVEILDADQDEATGHHYIVMEYVPGRTARDALARGPLGIEQAWRIIRSVAGALEEAARHRIVHRDIKPSNILVDAEDSAKLADLGIARDLGDVSDALTGEGHTLGTPHYMSPEQMRSPTTVDTRSDIYSLGATWFHLVTGRVPFPGSSIVEVCQAVACEATPDPRSLRPDLPESMARLIGRMLEKDPASRPQTVTVLLSEMDITRPSPGVDPTATLETSPGGETAVCGVYEAIDGEDATGAARAIEMGGEAGAVEVAGAIDPGGSAVTAARGEDAPPPERQPAPGHRTVVLRLVLVALVLLGVPIGRSMQRRVPVWLPLDPVAAYHFDSDAIERDGSTVRIRDHSGSGNDARVATDRGRVRFGPGRHGGCAIFHGDDGCLELESITVRSVSMWFNPGRLGSQILLDLGTGPENGRLGLSLRPPPQGRVVSSSGAGGPDVVLALGGGGEEVRAPTGIEPRSWHHLTISLDREGRLRVAIDGARPDLITTDGDRETSTPQPLLIATPTLLTHGPIRIGALRGEGPRDVEASFQGRIDDLAIWSRGLNDNELEALYLYGRYRGSYIRALPDPEQDET